MISGKQAKFIKSLQYKKYRKLEGAFVVEGKVSVLEALNSELNLRTVYCTPSFQNEHLKEGLFNELKIEEVSERDLNKVGNLKSNNSAIAVVDLPDSTEHIDASETVLVLDNINDPGNLGTIMRIADWYGINQLVCSPDTTDAFSPKCISASKGSFTRVRVVDYDLPEFLNSYPRDIYGALLSGQDVHKIEFRSPCAIVIGNESHGIRAELISYITEPITIPRYGGAESLNAAIATAIICDVYRQGATTLRGFKTP
ncbi:MAG: RNA methyltransferase [Bacteroidota bacterium]